jgi:hypothetical protein
MEKTSITFVTAFMNIYDTPFQNKDVEWRFRHFKKIAETGIQVGVFCSPDCSEYMEQLVTEFPNVKVIQYMNLKDTWTYQLCDEAERTIGESLALPNTRNAEKDTREYIILMNTKTEYLKMAIEANPWSSTHFAWIDFNIYHIFNGREQYIYEYLKSMSQRTMNPYFLTLPGCWGKEHVHEEFLMNDICWRFCGGFFIGSANRCLEFHKCYQDYFFEFLTTKKKLIWEVNFWAYLELRHGLSVIWYPGDHNEKILEISVKNMALRLSDLPSCQHVTYEYPDHGDFIPTSTAYLNYRGKDIINTRYVNYWLHPNGAYWIKDPDSYIRTRNFYSPLDGETLLPSDFKEMNEHLSGLTCSGGHIYGLEDIRLYEHGGEVQYIATSINYSGLGRNRMIKGKYDIDRSLILSSEVLVPPHPDSWCEKNWIPLVNYCNDEDEYFIYKWNPLEIGVLRPIENSDQKQLVIQKAWNHNAPLFSNIRGSTPLVECDEGFLCVVHFSYEGGPRNYFHMLVLLEKVTMKPLKYSEFFFFNNMSVEFCIGFMMRNEKCHFWISNFDRDPELVIVDRSEIPLLFDFYY